MEDFLHAAGDILLMGPDAPQPEETEPAEAEGSLLAMMEQEEKAAEGQLEEGPGEASDLPSPGPPPQKDRTWLWLSKPFWDPILAGR